jgi:PAS domain S-box-containing protein
MCTSFLIVWHSRDVLDDGYYLILGISFLFTAAITLVHTLTYKGMTIMPGYDANLPTQLWIAARLLFAVSVFAAPFFLKRKISASVVFILYTLITTVLFAAILTGVFPVCYIEGAGLTAFKIYTEYGICLLLAGSLYLHYRARADFDPEVWGSVAGAIITAILAELMFTLYTGVYGFFNMLGHLLLILSMYLFYRGIVVIGIREPHRLMYRTLQQSKEEIVRLNRYNRSLIDSAPAPIVIIGPDGIVADVNPVASQLTGCPREEMIGKPHAAWITEPEKAEEAFRRVLAGEEARDTALFIRHRDGNLTPIISNASPLRDAEGNIIGVIRSSLDISQRKQTEDALRFANEKLNILSSITRHDILNQLTALLGYLELSQELVTDPEIRIFIEKEETVANNIRRQIEFTREYQNLGVGEPVWVNLSDTFTKAADSLGCSARREISPDCMELEVYADALFERVFYNLVDNTLRHGERVTKITFSCARDGDAMTLVYEDNGTGVPADQKERIFERGFGKNTGLGLFLVRQILSITGMTIRETGEPGHGARFEIFVPRNIWRYNGASPGNSLR